MARKKNKAVYKCASPFYLIDNKQAKGEVVCVLEHAVPNLLGMKTNNWRHSLPLSLHRDVEVVLPRELT